MRLSKIIYVGMLAGIISLITGCVGNEDTLGPSAFATTDTIPGPGDGAGDLGDIFPGGTDIAGPTGFQAGGAESLSGADTFGEPIPNLNFPTIYFAYDQDQIGASERTKLERVADYMNKYGSVGVIIEGHCDERGSAEYNRALGERRALSVKHYLTNLGVPETKLKTISYGEERPVVSGETPEAYTKNRRAELVPVRLRQ